MSGDLQARGRYGDAEQSRGAETTYPNEEQQPDAEHWQHFAPEGEDGGPQGRRRARPGPDRRILIAGGAGVAALLLLTLALWRPWAGLDPIAAALGGDSAAVLIQIRGEDGRAEVSAIVMHDRTGTPSAVVGVPDDLAVDVPILGIDESDSPDGVVTIADALHVAGESLTRDGLSDVLGIEINGSLVLDARAFGTLIDRLSGIEIDGTRVDGDIAIARATVAADPPAVRAERFVEVMTGVLARMPSNHTATADLLNAIGLIGNGTLPPAQLAAILSGAGADQDDGELRTGVLAVQPGGLLDIEQAFQQVRDLLGSQMRERSAEATPRVLVQIGINASSDELARLKEQARADVVNAGYRFIDGGTVDPRPASSITLYGNSGIGEPLALALGLDRELVTAGSGDTLADVVVVLGGDYGR